MPHVQVERLVELAEEITRGSECGRIDPDVNVDVAHRQHSRKRAPAPMAHLRVRKELANPPLVLRECVRGLVHHEVGEDETQRLGRVSIHSRAIYEVRVTARDHRPVGR
jgi:hypothetical protein